MTIPRPCGCKGTRTCLICETQHGAENLKLNLSLDKQRGYVYCPLCNKAWSGWDMDLYKQHPNHGGESIEYPGVYIQLDFITETEEESLIKNLDEIPWDTSQSGRRKQNYGPKTNFKKRKMVPGNFEGFPECTKFIQDRFNKVGIMKGYETIEQCSLEYDPTKGASIDPHIDDCWVWGERVVTVNLLSDTILTMTPYTSGTSKYNLQDAQEYIPVVLPDGSINTNYEPTEKSAYDICKPSYNSDIIVRLPMPRRSTAVLYGESRYHWEHFILREDILSRRVCIAYREFTPTYMTNGSHQGIGDVVRQKGKVFFDHRIKYKEQDSGDKIKLIEQ